MAFSRLVLEILFQIYNEVGIMAYDCKYQNFFNPMSFDAVCRRNLCIFNFYQRALFL